MAQPIKCDRLTCGKLRNAIRVRITSTHHTFISEHISSSLPLKPASSFHLVWALCMSSSLRGSLSRDLCRFLTMTLVALLEFYCSPNKFGSTFVHWNWTYLKRTWHTSPLSVGIFTWIRQTTKQRTCRTKVKLSFSPRLRIDQKWASRELEACSVKKFALQKGYFIEQ